MAASMFLSGKVTFKANLSVAFHSPTPYVTIGLNSDLGARGWTWSSDILKSDLKEVSGTELWKETQAATEVNIRTLLFQGRGLFIFKFLDWPSYPKSWLSLMMSCFFL